MARAAFGEKGKKDSAREKSDKERDKELWGGGVAQEPRAHKTKPESTAVFKKSAWERHMGRRAGAV
jgi:hypothetical protein